MLKRSNMMQRQRVYVARNFLVKIQMINFNLKGKSTSLTLCSVVEFYTSSLSYNLTTLIIACHNHVTLYLITFV